MQFVITRIFFAMAFLLAVAELFEADSIILIFKPLLIPTLAFLYVSKSKKRNWWYMLALLFAWISNISFIFPAEEFVVYGFLSFMFYRIVCIVLVVKLVHKFFLLPFVIATMPFIFIFSCLLNLTLSTDAPEFYPACINGLLISALSGLSLSNYVMNDNKMNSWLAISSLLFVVLVFLFMIQKYYISNVVFQPISALIFSFGHYTFYRFMLETEKPVEQEIRQI